MHNHDAPDLPADPAIDDAPPTTPPYVDIVTDLANVLTLVQHVFVGQCDVRREITRVLNRYAEDQRECFHQIAAERDRWGIPLSLRADILEDSRAIDLVAGF